MMSTEAFNQRTREAEAKRKRFYDKTSDQANKRKGQMVRREMSDIKTTLTRKTLSDLEKMTEAQLQQLSRLHSKAMSMRVLNLSHEAKNQQLIDRWFNDVWSKAWMTVSVKSRQKRR